MESLTWGCKSKFLSYIGLPQCSFVFMIFTIFLLYDSNSLREGGVFDSIGGIFSLSELRAIRLIKIFWPILMLCWAGAWSRVRHVYAIINFLQSQDSWEVFGGNCFPSFDGFFHGQNFSVCFSSVLYQQCDFQSLF